MATALSVRHRTKVLLPMANYIPFSILCKNITASLYVRNASISFDKNPSKNVA